MKVIDFNNNQYIWPPRGHEVSFDDTRPRSSLHIRCRELLRQMYPTQSILEEVPIPSLNLFCDFYLPLRKVMIECHGEQHFKFTPHFHGNKIGFIKSQQRDKMKSEWCKINNIKLVELSFDENDEEWRKAIEDA
jgi:hypothetical protein